MRNHLAPTLQYQIHDDWLLWFAKTNRYAVVSNLTHTLLNRYLQATKQEDFAEQLTTNELLNLQSPQLLAKELKQFLKALNTEDAQGVMDVSHVLKNDNSCHHTVNYDINGHHITLHYDTQNHLNLVHHDLASYQVAHPKPNTTEFWLYAQNGKLHLFKDEIPLTCVPETDYHYIQGKFKMHVLCTLYNSTELDWIGTLHASTVALNHQATLLIGNSGSGKTTLTGLLVAAGFDLVADDLTALHTKDKQVYSYPGALSVKQGAYPVLSSDFEALTSISPITHNKFKGPIRYLPVKQPEQNQYSAKRMVLVNYQPDTQTHLEVLSVSTAMEILVPESWLAPKLENAQGFLQWLKGLEFYKLTYSNNKEAIEVMKRLHHIEE